MAEKASTAVEAANIVEQPGAGMVRAGLLPSTDLARVMLAAARRRIAAPIPVPLPPQKDKSLIIVSMLCK